MNVRGQKSVTRVLTAGIVCMVLGGLTFLLMLIGGFFRMMKSPNDASEILLAMPCALLFVGGMVLVGVGVFMGFKANAGNPDKTAHVPEAIVVSRFAVNQMGDMVFGDFEYEAPGGKLYVQLKLEDGTVSEYRTAWGVFCQCGEGMRGAALVKGNWLASFAPLLKQGDPLNNPQL